MRTLQHKETRPAFDRSRSYSKYQFRDHAKPALCQEASLTVRVYGVGHQSLRNHGELSPGVRTGRLLERSFFKTKTIVIVATKGANNSDPTMTNADTGWKNSMIGARSTFILQQKTQFIPIAIGETAAVTFSINRSSKHPQPRTIFSRNQNCFLIPNILEAICHPPNNCLQPNGKCLDT